MLESVSSLSRRQNCRMLLLVLFIVAGIMMMAGCGGSGSTTATTTPPATGTIGLSSTSLKFSSYLQGTTSPAQSVTVTNSGGTVLAIASIALGGTNGADFALASGSNQCTYAGQNLSAGASCSIYATFTPASVQSFSATVTVTDNTGGVSGATQTISLAGAGMNNTAQLNVSLGPNGNYANNITTSVTVCAPGTTNCSTIPDVLVDSGSVGLRLLSSGAAGVTTQVGSLGLTQITDSTTGYPLYECVAFGDFLYTWGPMAMATVTVGGETAAQIPGGAANSGIPIQIISTDTPPAQIANQGNANYNPCTYKGSTLTNDVNGGTVENLGFNGILGIGNSPQDCGLTQNYCTDISTTTQQYLEYDSTGISIGGSIYNYVVEATPLQYQAWNPVSAFATDNNGSILTLPSISAGGSGPLTGTLMFGIGTETDNAITTQTTYELDQDGNFGSFSYNTATYTSANSGGAFLDSGSNGMFIADETTLSAGGVTITDCPLGSTDESWYCPASTQSLLPLTLSGFNSTSNSFTLSVGNEVTLTASGNAAFDNLAGPGCKGGSASGCTAATDFWNIGLPFFFGRTVFIGISQGATLPNGYWAF